MFRKFNKKGVHLENITSYKMLSVKAQYVDGLQQKAEGALQEWNKCVTSIKHNHLHGYT